jgi:hypothetical protein
MVALSDISGVNSAELREHYWARAWRLVGEASDFVLALLEEHEAGPSTSQTVQFLHYITNGLGMGMQCLYVPMRMPF